MFRWLALCLVLCAGAFALVAMATGAFNPPPPPAAPDLPPVTSAEAAPNDAVQAAAGAGLGHGGAVYIKDARLTAIEREEVPSQHDGTMLVVGTDEPAGPNEPAEMLPPIRVPFPALQIDAKDPNKPVDPKTLPPESEWLFIRSVPDSKFKEAYGPTRLGKGWDDYKKDPRFPIYRRWHEGDPLQPGKVEMVFEQKVFRKLREGEWVKKGQLLALVDPTVQVNDVSSKVAKMETAEADYQAAIKTKEEAIRRASSAELLYSKGKGYISEDDYRAALLNKDRYIEEESSKDAARQVASEELSASISLLKLHEIRASIPGIVKVIYRRQGEAVKNLDPVVQIQNPLKLRVEGLADVQDCMGLSVGMPVIVEPTRPKPPLAVLIGHQGEVTCVAVSRPGADGKKLILSGSEDGTLRFWDWTAKQPQIGLLDHHAGVTAVACTGPAAAQNLALSGDRDGVGRLIDLDHMLPTAAAAGDAAPPAPPIKLAERHKGPITCVAFSPDGTVCATGGEDRAIRLWDATDGKLLNTVPAAHKAAVTSLQFAQQRAKRFISCPPAATTRWCLGPEAGHQDPKRGVLLPYRSGDVAKLGVSADGKHVLFDHGPELRVLSLDDRQIEGVIRSPAATMNFTTMAQFAPDGNTVLTNSASEGRLQLWRTPGRVGGDADQDHAAELRQFVWNSGTATSGAFDPDAAFAVTGSRDNFVLVWGMPKADEVLAKPRETKLTLVERALDNGARQVRVWAEVNNDDYGKGTGLTPGGTATMVPPDSGSRTSEVRSIPGERSVSDLMEGAVSKP